MRRRFYAVLTRNLIRKNVLIIQEENPENMQYDIPTAYFRENSKVEFFKQVPWELSNDSVILSCSIDSELYPSTGDLTSINPKSVSVDYVVADFSNMILLSREDNPHLMEVLDLRNPSFNDLVYVDFECLISTGGKSYKRKLSDIVKQ